MDAQHKDLHATSESNVPAMLFNLSAVAFCITSLASGWPTKHPVWIAALILMLVYFQHCWTIVFHEDAHYALYKSRWHNIFNGWIVGTLLMIPFDVYRQVHIRHHSKMNGPEDWELWPYSDPKTSLRFRRWFLWFDVFAGLLAGPLIYGRIYWVRHSPISDPRLRRLIAIEYAVIALFWGGLWTAVAWNGWWAPFALAYLIPAYITGVVQTMRKLTEHLGLPMGDAMTGARTVISHRPIARFASWTAFHIEAHGLHHKYPQMPGPNLERALELDGMESGQPVFSTYSAAIRDMLPHLWRPAVGVNVAAPAGAN